MGVLEGMQRRFTRVLPGLDGFSYEERLDKLRLLLLERWRLRGDLIDVYRIVRGTDRVAKGCASTLGAVLDLFIDSCFGQQDAPEKDSNKPLPLVNPDIIADVWHIIAQYSNVRFTVAKLR
eukprot:g43534.t1